jgi:hypothetical protein
MKKVFGLLAIVGMIVCVSCKSNTPATEENVATEENAVVDETAAVSDSTATLEEVVEETPAQ